MKVLSLFTTTALLSAVGFSSAADDYVYGKDPKKDAEYDISMGMAGIQQAAQDPKLLAQLFQDMQVSFWIGLSVAVIICRSLLCFTVTVVLVSHLHAKPISSFFAHRIRN